MATKQVVFEVLYHRLVNLTDEDDLSDFALDIIDDLIEFCGLKVEED